MLQLLVPLRHIFELDQHTIDNAVFQLHYKMTSRMLFIFVVVVTTREFIGDSISCMLSGGPSIPRDVLNSFCWIQSTFSLPKSGFDRGGPPPDDQAVIYPGVDQYIQGDDRVFHQFYQWVPFFLSIQAVAFYLPSFWWRSVENRKIEQIVGDLRKPMSSATDQRLDQIASYVWDNRGHLNRYSNTYFVCEALNFVNVVLQILVTNFFLNGSFFTYGIEVLRVGEQDKQLDPMIAVFPRMAKCAFRNYGPSGDIQNFGAICILPINSLNEKIYVFLWFWLVVLAFLSGLVLVYRLVLLASKQLRRAKLRYNNRLANAAILERFIRKVGLSEWLLLNFLSKNMNLTSFKETVNILAVKMSSGGSIEEGERKDGYEQNEAAKELITS